MLSDKTQRRTLPEIKILNVTYTDRWAGGLSLLGYDGLSLHYIPLLCTVIYPSYKARLEGCYEQTRTVITKTIQLLLRLILFLIENE